MITICQSRGKQCGKPHPRVGADSRVCPKDTEGNNIRHQQSTTGRHGSLPLHGTTVIKLRDIRFICVIHGRKIGKKLDI